MANQGSNPNPIIRVNGSLSFCFSRLCISPQEIMNFKFLFTLYFAAHEWPGDKELIIKYIVEYFWIMSKSDISQSVPIQAEKRGTLLIDESLRIIISDL